MQKIKTYRMIYPDNQLYYSLDKVLTFDVDVVMVQSIRNLGKSYSARQLVYNTLEKGYNCAWLRWTPTESASSLEKFKEKDVDRYLPCKLKDTKISYCIDTKNDNKCYFLPVKGAMDFKDFGIERLKYVVYDECVPEHYDIKTRRETEFLKLMSLFNTLKRDNKTKLIMICNVIDWFNPFTSAWGIYPFNAGLVKVFTIKMNLALKDDLMKTYENRILFENVKPTPAMINRVAQLEVMRGNYKTVKEYFDNVAKVHYDLIGKCPAKNIQLANLQLRIGTDYYSYRIYDNIMYFVKCGKRDISTESPDIRTMNRGEYRTPEIGKQLETYFNIGALRFDTGHTYNAICQAIYKYREHL